MFLLDHARVAADVTAGRILNKAATASLSPVRWPPTAPHFHEEIDYTEQSSWLLFLKYLDALEADKATEAALSGRKYAFILDQPCRWESWAAPKGKDGQIDHNNAKTGDDLTAFVNGKLFPYLMGFKQRATGPDTVEYKIGEIFGEIHTNTLTENLADITGKGPLPRRAGQSPLRRQGTPRGAAELPHRTGETAFLFLQHFIEILKAGGRGGVVIENTFLSNTDNASVSSRKLLLESCSLHTVLDCPGGTFQGAGVKTVVLFFGKLDANAAVEGGKYPFFTCSRDIYAIDTYATETQRLESLYQQKQAALAALKKSLLHDAFRGAL